MKTCRLCERERKDWQVREYPDGERSFIACVDVLDCSPHADKVQRRLDKAAFASLGIDYETYRGVLS